MIKKADIVFVYPGIAGCGFNSFGKSVDSSWISHGLSLLSSCLQSSGYSVLLLDLRQLSGWKEFEEKIKKIKPEIVGITMMSVDYNPAIKAAEIIKKINPLTKIIVGGPHPTLVPEELKNDKRIDYLVTGEGEISLPNLIKEIKAGKKVAKIIGGVKPDLDQIPFADRKIFGAFEKPIVSELPEPFVSIIAGRGCLYNCSFCKPAEDKLFGKPVRRRSVANVIGELKELERKYHFKSLMIHDDCLTEDRKWVENFCQEYQKNGFKQPFVCQSRADIICRNEDMVKLMAKTGLYMYLIGFESGNQRVLNFIRKGTTVKQNIQAAEICKKYGIRIWANYMAGLPTETKDEVYDTVSMIRKIKPDYFSPAFFTPHPGSDLYTYCQKHKLSLIKSHDQFRRDPTEVKIKGQEYFFLKEAVRKSMEINFLDKIQKYVRKNMQKLIWKITLT
jgi:anaerobic magnesium-protoporphyrin IX monomethyl ester cyclase